MPDDHFELVKDEKTLPVRICDYAHEGPHADLCGHRDGFCLACAEIYLAVNRAFLDGV